MNSYLLTKKNLIHASLNAQHFNKLLKACVLICLTLTTWMCSQQQTLQKKESALLPDKNLIQLDYARQLQKTAEQSETPQKLLIQSAYIYAQLGETRALHAVLLELEGFELNQAETAVFVISKAELLNLNHDIDQALKQLDQIDELTQLEIGIQSFYTDIKAKSYLLQGKYILSARERVFINPILSVQEQSENCHLIWQAVSKLNSQQLEQALQQENEPTLKGWLELAFINKAYFHNLELQNEKFTQWEKNNPTHDANKYMPGSIKAIKLALKNKPKKIALLLPESGPFEKSADAIRQGFLYNFYRANENQGNSIELIFFDTSEEALTRKIKNLPIVSDTTYSKLALDEQGFLLTYKEALAHNVDLIIGPINKQYIALLQTYKNDKVPTLSLNYTDNPSTSIQTSLFQFGLAPEHEIDFIIKQAHKNKLKNVAILSPENEWGNRLSETFEQHWQASGGTVVSKAHYTDTRGLTQVIEKMLSIDLSEQRFKRLYWYSEGKTIFYSRRRQDIDFIFLVASPEMGRQIVPTFAFHDANDLPVYASSNVYSGQYNNKDKDMNRLIFSEIPAMITPDNSIQSAWSGQDFRYKRLIAMGMDTYDLAIRLSILRASRNNVLFGQTGNLSMSENNVISREPSLARFSNSHVVLQPSL